MTSAHRPAVALESTIYAFGFPYTHAVELGWKLAREIHAQGAESKTMAVLDGRMAFGLTDDELDRIARGDGVKKLAASDLGAAVAQGTTGATTVSATMAMAVQAGARVFATGGIGGVHRGAGDSFDESQDLWALSKFPVAVVSAGVKAILDLPKTLERLESYGVPVIGFQTKTLPAFYTQSSGLKLSLVAESINELARMVQGHWDAVPGAGGVLVANPIPAEHALNEGKVNAAIDAALAEADAAGQTGKAVTPFVLAAMERLTKGASVTANTALAVNNARVAAALAVALDKLPKKPGPAGVA